MGDEWVEKRVADLEAGDVLRGYGRIESISEPLTMNGEAQCERYACFEHVSRYLPAHARVDVRRAGVAVKPDGNGFLVVVGTYSPAWMRSERHAECYAEKLRNDPKLRAEALGQP